MDPWRYATSRNSLNAFFAETHHDITCWGVASVCSSVLLLLVNVLLQLPRLARQLRRQSLNGFLAADDCSA